MVQELAPHRALTSSAVALAVPDERVVLETLAEVGVAFTNERQLDPVLDRLLGTVLQVVRADAGSVMLLSRERDTLVVVAARGPRARTVMPRGGYARHEPSAPTGCSSTANGTCGQSWASTPSTTTGTARTSPASNDRPTTTTKPTFRWTCRSTGGKSSAA